MNKGYDVENKVSRIKRHITVDTNGLPHAIAVTTAEVNDRAGAKEACKHHKSALSSVESVLVDGSYTGEPFANTTKELLEATVQVAKRNELHIFELSTSLQFIHCAFLALLLRRS